MSTNPLSDIGLTRTETLESLEQRNQAGDELDELFDYQPAVSSESDMSEDDGSYKTPRSRVRKASTKVLDLGTILKAPRATQYSTRTIYTMVKDDIIDLEPEYQRGVVWPAEKQSAVIESIMRHYYVPPVLLSMQKQESAEDDLTYVCIDGKQRMSSICAFLDNKIPVKEPETNRKFWYKEDLAAGRTPALNAAQRRKFDNEQITVVEFEGLSEEVERDMFSRVQMGVTLSPAEKLGAHLGPWPDFIRQMVKRFIDPTPSLVHDEEGKSMLVVNRGRDYLFIAQMALLIQYYENDQFMPSASAVDTFLKHNAKTQPSPHLRQTLQRTLERYVALANHRKYGKCIKPESKLIRSGHTRAKPLSPAEFVYVAFLIFKFPDATVAQLYDLVQGMKADVRSQFKDVLMNNNIANTMRRYINKAKLSEGEGSTPRNKRQRPDADSDEDGDVPLSARRRTANGLDVNPDAGLFRNIGDSPSRNPLTNVSPAPPRR